MASAIDIISAATGPISSLISGGFGYGAAKLQSKTALEVAEKTAASNKEIAEMQIEAQKEANEAQQQFEIEQANVAFERNSAQGVLKQLIAAGLTEQQARQYIANNGGGTYTAAPSVNPMQGVDYSGLINSNNQLAAGQVAASQANANGLQNLGNSLAQSTSAVLDSFRAPDGGALGIAVASRAMDIFTDCLPYIDKNKVHTYADLEQWYNGLEEGDTKDKLRYLVKSQEFQHVKNFYPAIRAFNSYMNQVYTSNLTSSSQLSHTFQDTALKQSQEVLTTLTQEYQKRATLKVVEEINLTAEETELYHQKIESEKLSQRQALVDILSSELHYENDVVTLPYINESTIAQCCAMINELTLRADWFNDPKNAEVFMQHMTSTLEGETIAAALAALNGKNAIDKIENNGAVRWLSSMHNALNNAGFQIVNSTAGTAGATALLLKAIKAVPK